MSFLDSISDKTISTAIKVVATLIVIVLVAGIGYLAYQQIGPKIQIPPLVQEEIDKALQTIAKDPKDADTRVKLAGLYVGQKMWNDAQTELDNAISINKNHIGALSLLGQVAEARGQTANAIDYYKKAIALSDKTEFKSLNPFMYESIYRLGSIYIEQKKYKEAIDVLKKGTAVNPIDSDLHVKLGEAYVLNKQPDEAIAELEQGLTYVPNFAEGYYWLGRAYEVKGDKEKAKANYEQAMKFKKGYTQAEEALSKLK
ncbi:MAG: tetratricopeptide repeat protein [Actinomycetota bacterium]